MEIEANDPDDVFDNIDIDEAIQEMLSSGSTTINIKYGKCVPYVYKGTDDCEWFDLGEIEVTDKDLDIDWFEIACILNTEVEQCKINMSNCVKNMIAIKEDVGV